MPAAMADAQTEFEWENKVALNAPEGDLRNFVDHLAKETNLQILTPENALSGDCSYLSCNMAAKSLRGGCTGELQSGEDG
jgi:coatomer subunit beta